MNLNLNQNLQQNNSNTAQNLPQNSQNISQSSFQASNPIHRSINNLQSSQITTSSQEIQSQLHPQIHASQGHSSNDPRVQNATIGIVVGMALIIYLIFELYIYDQFDL